MWREYSALFLFCCFFVTAFGQVLNDECADAIRIDNPSNFCSPVAGYSTEGATPSGFEPGSCFDQAGNDVWFSFVPVATTVTVTVIGNNDPANTLPAPEVALYSGSCDQVITEWRCGADSGNGILEITRSGLQIGERYLVRVQGRNGAGGSFQLCLRNFNPPVEPGQDCNTMSVLCNKESFVVRKVTGPGLDPTEANDASCFDSALDGADVESASTWFTWTALNDGPLTFDLIPINPTDDLDFALYELPNGPGNCDDKVLLRCMASSCIGPTGLRDGEIDLGEPPNCSDPRQNNYLRPLEMEAGKSYALMVNNFSETGNGFDVQFGGAGEFQGPEAEFRADRPDGELCPDEEVLFTDISRFPGGNITDWSWDFGPTASLATAAGPGPHAVSFSGPGVKSVVLTITTEEGCTVTEVGTLEVGPCCENNVPVVGTLTDISGPVCFGGADGSVTLEASGGTGPYRYAITGRDFQAQPVLDGLAAGRYEVLVQDALGCLDTLIAEVDQPEPVVVDAGPDLTVTLGRSVRLSASAADPLTTFTWSPPERLSCSECPQPEARPVRNATFRVQATDPDGCVGQDSVQVRIDADRPVFFPNAFSPDGDGQNDFFGVFGGPGLRQVRSLRVFDRWGNLLFERENLPANEPSAGWDGRSRGRELGTGVYVYLAEVEFIDDVVLAFQGDILLIR